MPFEDTPEHRDVVADHVVWFVEELGAHRVSALRSAMSMSGFCQVFKNMVADGEIVLGDAIELRRRREENEDG
jgi:hypothetical protein